jgi:hypothetical protein
MSVVPRPQLSSQLNSLKLTDEATRFLTYAIVTVTLLYYYKIAVASYSIILIFYATTCSHSGSLPPPLTCLPTLESTTE